MHAGNLARWVIGAGLGQQPGNGADHAELPSAHFGLGARRLQAAHQPGRVVSVAKDGRGGGITA